MAVRVRALALTVSTRAATGGYADTTGPEIVAWLAARGFETAARIVADGPGVETALRAAADAGLDLVVTTGGTGITPSDRTPEATRAVIEFEVPGFGEQLRRLGAAHSPTALLSRGLAGVAGTTLIANLPGSPGGVRDGLAVLDGLYAHALDQLRGGDHAR